jgi:hypothetical protein
MPQRLLYKFQVLKSLTKRNLSTKLGFITNHSNLTKRCWGELTKVLGRVFLLVGPTASKGGRGKAFILTPKN